MRRATGNGRRATDREETPVETEQKLQRLKEILREMEKITKEIGMSMSQLSLAWLLANPAITSPIIGASRLEQLEDNVDVANRPILAQALKRISEVSKPDWLREQEQMEAQSRVFREQRRSYWQKRLEEKR